MSVKAPPSKDLVLIGGGHAHALVLREWGENPQKHTRLTLINPGPVAPYSGMLPGLVAGHYSRAELEIDLVQLAQFSGARLVQSKAIGIDPETQTILVEGGPPVPFDIASIDVGITTEMHRMPGFAQHAVPAKPFDGFVRAWETFAGGAKNARVVIIGGGVAGVELALAAAHRLQGNAAQPEITVLEAGPAALRELGKGAAAAMRAQLAAYGVKLHLGARVTHVTAQGPVLENGALVASEFTIGVAGAQPHPWLGQSGLQMVDGYIEIGPDLRSTSHPNIFAVGDCAHMGFAPRPKAGVFAVRQAPVLTHNLRAALSGGGVKRYAPQKDYLKLISTGRKRAVADKFGRRIEGDWLWRLKDRIDRAFMSKFQNLPKPPADQSR